MTKLTDPIDDQELDRRLRATFHTVMPMLDTHDMETRPGTGPTPSNDPGDDLDFGTITSQTAPHRRRLSTVGASLLAAAAVATLFVIVGQRGTGTPAPPIPPAQAAQPNALPSAAPVPGWYSTIRPLLPEGFDQIVLADSTPQSINFVAFRTDTRQLLDVALSIEPGFGKKETSDPVTFEDTNGTYKQTASGVWLDTTDDRYVSIRCGLVPIGGGGIGDVGFTNEGERDDCGDGFEHLDLGAEAMRTLAANLATNLTITPDNSSPDGALLGVSVAPTAEAAAVEAQIARYVGDDRITFPIRQFDVIRAANLSPTLNGPMTTQLSIIHGIYPPRAADTNPSNLPTAVDPPDTRFRVYDNIAVAMVVTDDGTGFHVATSDLDPQHLTDLGALLNQLVLDQTATSPDTTEPATTDPGQASESTTALPGNTDPVVAILYPTGQQATGDALADALRGRGITVETLAESTRTPEQSMLMPISGESNPASYTVGKAIRIDGFDTWTPNLAQAPLPVTVTDVIILGNDGGPALPLPEIND